MAHALCAAIAIAVPVLLVSPIARGEAGPIEISLQDALARAEEQSPLVKRARLERAVVEAARVGAGLRLPANPAVSAAVGARTDHSSSVPPARGVEGAVRIEQMLEIGGQRGARLAEVDAGVKVARARERLARVETRARARSAYLAVQLADAQVASAQHREELGRRLYDSARARVQAGAASDVELHLTEVEVGRLASERVDAELQAEGARAELRRLVDLPIETPLRLTTPLAPPTDVPAPLPALLTAAEQQREELRALDARGTQLDATVLRLHRENIPNPILAFDYAHQQPGQDYYGAGLALPIPLWRRHQGELAEVHAERARLAGERSIVDREIAAEVARARRTAITRRDEEERWRRQLVPVAETNVELVTQGWQAGKFDLFRVIQVAREAGEARHRQLELLGALWQAVIDLDRATGRP